MPAIVSLALLIDPSEDPISFGRGTLCLQRHSSLLIVALNRPNVKNAFNDDVYLDLIDCMQLVIQDNLYSGMILTGTGDYFSSGADLSSNFLSDDGGPRNTLLIPPGQFMMALLSFPKLICAAVNGPAVGIGVTLLLHCDLVWCSTTSTFWAPFPRLALVPELCSSVTFIDSMGLSKANELLLLGITLDAPTAVAWNIASRVVSIQDHPASSLWLALAMAHEVDARLLQLPRGPQTAQIFCQLLRGPRMDRLQHVCREELRQLDQRMNAGECLEAAMQLKIGQDGHKKTITKQQPASVRSKL
jgi:Delta3-Delta2-enoyl-CoA isomerase